MTAVRDAAPDERLLLTARAEPGAFGVFYRRHEDRVLGYFLARVGDPELAADLTAETFAAALASAHRFRRCKAPASAWLFGIARNTLAMSRRPARESRFNGGLGRVFDHVAIAVSDLAASERFYRTVLNVLGDEPSHADAELVEWDDWDIAPTERKHPVTRAVENHGTDRGRMLTPRLLTPLILMLAFVAAACGGSQAPATAPRASTTPDNPRTHALGAFPQFPRASLPKAETAGLQGVLDGIVEDGTFLGVTAAVIVADRGHWEGAAGSADGTALTPDSRRPIHSSGKTIVAAEVLRLVEKGKLGLDDRASDHLPPELRFFDANGATIRQVLAMRSGIPDLNEDAGYYPAEQASSAGKVFRKLRQPEVRPGSESHYASTNYVLLGAIIEHATGRPLAEVLRSDVLDRPGLDGLVYTVEDALAADGWGVESTPTSLARWGYELYGGFVLSETSLLEMTHVEGYIFGLGYGLGVVDFSDAYGTLAVGHPGESSVTTCCSAIRLVALPKDGVVIAVQANTDGAATSDAFGQVEAVTIALRDAARG
jgi:D-alanyl-D-alanine carboxypeptidase